MERSKDRTVSLATRLATEGRSPDPHVVSPPLYRASTHLYADCAALRDAPRHNKDGQFFYGRRGSPTQWALSDALTAIEPGAYGTVLYPSGVAAIAGAMLAVVAPGDVLLVTDNAYEPTRHLANGLLKRMGVETRYFDPLDLDSYRAAFCERTSAVLLESPGSLSFEVCDIPALAAIAREHGACTLVDNTWASGLGFAALEHGCDITIQALTKHVGGHSDLLMGSATAASAEWYRKLRQVSQELGQVVSPDDAALALRGFRTMGLRLRHCAASALTIAEWLSERPEVAHVLCPMLPGAPGHDLWARDFTGGCGLFAFVLKGGDDAARCRLIDALELFGIGFSWGGFESLALPVEIGAARSATSWPRPGWDPADRFAIRLSIGLEDQGDLIADLERGFTAMKAG